MKMNISEEANINYVTKIDKHVAKILEILLIANLILLTVLVSVFSSHKQVVFTTTQVVVVGICFFIITSKKHGGISSFISIWFLWLVNGFVSYYSSEITSHVNTTEGYLLTIFIYVPLMICTFLTVNRKEKTMIFFVLLLFLLSLVPSYESNILFSPWKSIMRVSFAVIIYEIYIYKILVKVSKSNKKDTYESEMKKTLSSNVVCSVYYIFFGKLEIVILFFLVQLLLICMELYKISKIGGELETPKKRKDTEENGG